MGTERPFTLTFHGNKYYPGFPMDSEFSIADIAHHLAQCNRYSGGTLFPYSVAQHSVLMADKMMAATQDPILALDCLYHDAAEYVLGDMAKPIKVQLTRYNIIENATDIAIREWLREDMGVPVPARQTSACKDYDKRMLLTEWPTLKLREAPGAWFPDHEPFTDVKIEPWEWTEARDEFLFANESLVKMTMEKQND